MDSGKRRWVSQALNDHEQRLTRYVTRLLNGRLDLARDVVQHAFLKLCRQDPMAVGENVAAWLYKVCRNRALDELRKQKLCDERNRMIAVENVLNPDPHQSLEQTELLAGLNDLIARLPDDQREAVELWSHGIRFQEIGQLIGKSDGAVRVSVHRAIKQLRESHLVRAYLDLDDQSPVFAARSSERFVSNKQPNPSTETTETK